MHNVPIHNKSHNIMELIINLLYISNWINQLDSITLQALIDIYTFLSLKFLYKLME